MVIHFYSCISFLLPKKHENYTTDKKRLITMEIDDILQGVLEDLQGSAEDACLIIQKNGRGLLTRFTIITKCATTVQGLYHIRKAVLQKNYLRSAAQSRLKLQNIIAGYYARKKLKQRLDRIEAMKKMLAEGIDIDDNVLGINDHSERGEEENSHENVEEEKSAAGNVRDTQMKESEEHQISNYDKHVSNEETSEVIISPSQQIASKLTTNTHENNPNIMSQRNKADHPYQREKTEDDNNNNKILKEDELGNDKQLNQKCGINDYENSAENLVGTRRRISSEKHVPFDIRLVPQRAVIQNNSQWSTSANTLVELSSTDDLLYLSEVDRVITPPICFFLINNMEVLLPNIIPDSVTTSLTIDGCEVSGGTVNIEQCDSGVFIAFITIPVAGFHVVTLSCLTKGGNGEELLLQTQLPVETYNSHPKEIPVENWHTIAKLRSVHKLGELNGVAVSLLANLRAAPAYKTIVDMAACNSEYSWLSKLLKKNVMKSLPVGVRLPLIPKELLSLPSDSSTIVRKGPLDLPCAYPIRVLSKYSNSDYLPPKYLSDRSLSLIEKGLLPFRQLPGISFHSRQRGHNIPPWIPAGRSKPSKLQKLLACTPQQESVDPPTSTKNTSTVRRRVLPPLVNYNIS